MHFCECRFDPDKCACVDTPLDARYVISFNGLCTICVCVGGVSFLPTYAPLSTVFWFSLISYSYYY